MLKRLTILLLAISTSFFAFAQVTTSSISGTAKDVNGENLVGATVSVTHIPTGTVYRTLSLKNGVFNLVNLIPGGPYSITVSYVGHENYSQDNVTLPLGENTRIDAFLKTSGTVLEAVVVSTQGGGNVRRKTGASTNIGRQQIDALPTLNRSLSDITRITPQATGSNSFGGANNRFNNITIDGAVNNDVFGLAASGTPGGQANTTPISLDAIQEVQVVIAPYDITYGNFTGGGVNAVTRSGTNNYEGSVYYFFRNENTVGKDPVTKIKSTEFSNKQYGVRFGGPIIKNKLFFFANGELARITQPTLFNAGETNALLTTAQAQALADTLRKRYNYDVGTYDVFESKTQSDKIFGRIDWNVTGKHHLTLRHNYIKAYDDNISRSNTFFRFGNNAYRFNNNQNISVAELRSRISGIMSNDLILGLHRIRDFRSTYGELFPSIEISHNSGTIQTGSERSSTANELDQDIFEVTDNFKIFKGKNTFTIGTHNEFFKFRNLFINNYNGRWRFNSLNDFYGNFPRQFDVTFSANKAADPRPSAEFKASQLGFYAQDEIQFSRQFRLTVGFRVDVPVISTKPAFNPIVDSTFKSAYSTSNTPNGQLLYSPRVGFNYDIEGDRKRIVRGGIGIFSSRLPFVWLSNQYSNTGLLLKTTSQTDNTPTAAPFDVNSGKGFEPDVEAQSNIGSALNSFEADLIDKEFKLPQVLRMNLGFDIKFPGDINLTIEALYSKTLNNVFYQDVNLTAPVGVVDPAYNNGFDKRIAFASGNARRKNPIITNAILITNTNKGYTYNIGFTLNKTWKNFFGQVAYNHNGAADVNSGASSTALSQWEFVQVVGDPNNAGLAVSNYALKHRISAVVNYSISYAKHFKTSIGLFYSGNSGTPFTYLVNGDLNNDGRFGNDLIYVPANPSQIKFIDFLNTDNTVRFTAAQQAAAFEQFIQDDYYLRKRRGQYAERNGRSTPWEHVIDARIAQDFYITAGGKKHDLQVSFDIFNLTNLINDEWGRQYSVGNQAYTVLTSLNRTSGPVASQGKGYNFTIGQTPWSTNFGSRWQGQVGIRYTFN
ncbi:MAG TPA: carboxypeptidase regulatory-like domain-containing protein [Chitinophagaceae bacterium]|nr:carboxypeptidase regulatory-like domain-containing protein [Chitinophagaceae bacterium]